MTFPFQCLACGFQPGLLVLDRGSQPAPKPGERDSYREGSKYPLRLVVCQSCWLLQLLDWLPAEELRKHADLPKGPEVEGAGKWIQEFSLDRNSLVVELDSQEGGHLEAFKR